MEALLFTALVFGAMLYVFIACWISATVGGRLIDEQEQGGEEIGFYTAIFWPAGLPIYYAWRGLRRLHRHWRAQSRWRRHAP